MGEKNQDNQKESSDKNRRRLHSKDIFLGNREVVIEHNDDDYRLIITKSGKLILNK